MEETFLLLACGLFPSALWLLLPLGEARQIQEERREMEL